MSAEEKNYYVKNVMNKLVLNSDIIVGDIGATVRLFQSTNTDGAYIWPKGDVPVKIDISMRDQKNQINERLYDNAIKAIDHLNQQTNLRLTSYKDQRDYIRIMYSSETEFGGLSPVGRKGGEQIIYITRFSTTKTIVHELLHSLGFWHEQNRPDRDQYITIDTSKVKPPFRYAFQIEPGITNTEYDYKSIMHYDQYAFAIDQHVPVMKCKKNNQEMNCDLGTQFFNLSDRDIAGINTTYWFNRDVARRNYSESMGMEDVPSKRLVNRIPTAASETYVVDKTIADGVYMIKGTTTSKYLDITGLNKADGAILQQWDKVGGPNQQFAVQSAGKNIYTIKAIHSDKFLSVKDQSKTEEARIEQSAYTGLDNQKFYIEYSPYQGAYRIKGLQSDKHWFVRTRDNGDQLFQTSGATEYFYFERTGDLPGRMPSQPDINIRTKMGVKKLSGN